MLDDLAELRTFREVLLRGSLTTAARTLDVSLAVVSKRLATLERRTGVRLINRTTRRLSPTEEGERLLVEVERALEAIEQGEQMLATGRLEPIGLLRVSAPVSFGRRHVTPVLGLLTEQHPRLSIFLALEDHLADVVGGDLDVAIRIGASAHGGGAGMRKLADNRRMLVAAPSYLDRRGRPEGPEDLAAHDFLRFGAQAAPWRLFGPSEQSALVSAPARLRADSGDAVHGWCVAGHGIAVRSHIDVGGELRAGILEEVLPAWHAGNAPVVALFPDRATMPRKTRVFIDAMLHALIAR